MRARLGSDEGEGITMDLKYALICALIVVVILILLSIIPLAHR